MAWEELGRDADRDNMRTRDKWIAHLRPFKCIDRLDTWHDYCLINEAETERFASCSRKWNPLEVVFECPGTYGLCTHQQSSPALLQMSPMKELDRIISDESRLGQGPQC